MIVKFEDLKNKKEKICIVGLGYVGLPLAILLSKNFEVIGFDINDNRIEELKKGFDRTLETEKEDLLENKIDFTSNEKRIKESKFIIIAVPTPVDEDKKPDLNLLKRATTTVANNLNKNSVVVYESTVYPGATEEDCLPILEEKSGLKLKIDFKIGYSPERVNPGDKEHTTDKIIKVVSGSDEEALEIISKVYGTITNIFKAKSIKVAEAAKVIENTQRDLNIAFINELTILFNKMGLSIYDVLDAAKTKWNFLDFKPGMVGGHCIGVDPYYLTYKAKENNYKPEIILAGRNINDSMHKFIADLILKNYKKNITKPVFVILGITFKENIPDIRNSKVVDLIKELNKNEIDLLVYDPYADFNDVKKEYGIDLVLDKKDLPKADVLIVAVPHDEFKNLSLSEIGELMNDDSLLVDIKRIYNESTFKNSNINYITF